LAEFDMSPQIQRCIDKPFCTYCDGPWPWFRLNHFLQKDNCSNARRPVRKI